MSHPPPVCDDFTLLKWQKNKCANCMHWEEKHFKSTSVKQPPVASSSQPNQAAPDPVDPVMPAAQVPDQSSGPASPTSITNQSSTGQRQEKDKDGGLTQSVSNANSPPDTNKSSSEQVEQHAKNKQLDGEESAMESKEVDKERAKAEIKCFKVQELLAALEGKVEVQDQMQCLLGLQGQPASSLSCFQQEQSKPSFGSFGALSGLLPDYGQKKKQTTFQFGGEVCIVSWRWPTTGKREELPLKQRMYAITQRVQSLGYQHVLLDYISVDQTRPAADLMAQVEAFSSFYSVVPVVTYYPVTEMLLEETYEVPRREEEREQGRKQTETLTRVNGRGWIDLEIVNMFAVTWHKRHEHGGIPFSHLVPVFEGEVDFATLKHYVRSIYLNNIILEKSLTDEEKQELEAGPKRTAQGWVELLAQKKIKLNSSEKSSNMRRNRRANLLWSLGRPGFYLSVFDDVIFLGDIVPGASNKATVAKAKAKFRGDERKLRAWLQVYTWAFLPHTTNGFTVGEVRLLKGPIGDAAERCFTGFKETVMDQEDGKSVCKGTAHVEIVQTSDAVVLAYINNVQGYLGDEMAPLTALQQRCSNFFEALEDMELS